MKRSDQIFLGIGGYMVRKILILLLLTLIFVGCTESGLNLKIRYDKIQGLKEDDRVLFEKTHIGRVANVFYSEDGYYMVEVAIKKDFANTATEHSKFFIIPDPINENEKAIEIIQTPRGGTPLTDGAAVIGTERSSERVKQPWDNFGKTLDDLKKQFEEFSEDLRKIPESEEFKKLQKELERLLEQMKKSGDAAREKIQKEVLPRLKRELEELREKLEKLGREKEVEPLEVQMEKLRRI
jgi:Skp family chaperone for outer membrane proteins